MDALTKERRIDLLRLFERRRPNRAEAEEAVMTPIRWAGDDPDREGLLDTPHRVHKHGISTSTSRMLGEFKENPVLLSEFLASIQN